MPKTDGQVLREVAGRTGYKRDDAKVCKTRKVKKTLRLCFVAA